MRRVCICVGAISTLLVATLLVGSVAESRSAYQKLERIEKHRLPPGSRVPFTPAELNSWMQDEARYWAPNSARNLRLDLAQSRATGSADIDFLKLRQATTGEEPGWLMKNLFAGERHVVVTARFESRGHQARVDVERLEVSGVPIEGRTLDLLIQYYLRPTFPDAKVGEWFGLKYGVERFTVAPTGVVVSIGR